MVRRLRKGGRVGEARQGTTDISGTVAIVTGATRGIGRATALELGRAGADVVVVGRSTKERPDALAPGTLEDVVEQLRDEGIEALAVQADLTDSAQVAAVAERTLEWRGRCDLLVNNAAYTSNGPILEVPARRWQLGFQMQVTTPLQLCQLLVPGMLDRGHGHVINIGTRAAVELIPNLPLYGTTKYAQERMTQWLHFEHGGQGVSFNVYRIDTVVTTEGWHVVREQQGEEIAMGSYTATELVSPEECAGQIVWMARQPTDWSGLAVTIPEIRELRGLGTPS
jgi:NAD(P)-dependent dehydrogenase (short-subunit alcohol dehydrogenase family)